MYDDLLLTLNCLLVNRAACGLCLDSIQRCPRKQGMIVIQLVICGLLSKLQFLDCSESYHLPAAPAIPVPAHHDNFLTVFN